jgi:hypothetical protein
MKTDECIKILESMTGYRYLHVLITKEEQALSHAIAHMKRYRWQDIETAPRDGTVILLYSLKTNLTNKAFWSDIVEKWSGFSVIFDDPTHWMPLPEFEGE